MGEQSGSRLQGDRYQHLYSWFLLLDLLNESSHFEVGVVEHPHAGAADDVTLHPTKGSGVASRYCQVKWHVDHQDLYSIEELCRVKSGETSSLLGKLFKAWGGMHATGPTEVWLVSNWAASPDFGCFINGADHRLKAELFEGGARSNAGRSFKQIIDHLGAPDEVIRRFLGDFRLRLGFQSISELEARVDERMQVYKLKHGVASRASALDEIHRWIEEGGRRKTVTRESLKATILRLELLLPRKPAELSMWVHGWTMETYGPGPTVELDWTSHFDRGTRRQPTCEVWETKLLPELDEAKRVLSKVPAPRLIDFRGKLPLSASLAIGARFPDVAGHAFRFEQPTNGAVQLWRSDSMPKDCDIATTHERVNAAGDDLMLSMSITGDSTLEVERFIQSVAAPFKAVVHARPKAGVGGGVLRSDGETVALAVATKNLIREKRIQYGCLRTHLVLFCPAAFAFILGQKLNAVGEVVAYERTVDGGYMASVLIRTG